VEGKRSLERQQQLLQEGLTQTLQSKHVWPQQVQSLAVDVVPFVKGEQVWVQRPTGLQGAMWKAVRRYAKRWAQMAFLAGWIMAKADTLGIKLRWGGDWNEDFDFSDNNFDDIWHFELKSQAEQ
jgi:peptidoglycan L-alanyl-D-glutamate endopeptidase CwlK